MKTSHQTLVLAIMIVATTLSIKAQTLKKKYYIRTNQVEEEYYVNANGEKVGSYKSYYESGLIAVEANYKNGLLEGTYKEYVPSSNKSCLNKTTVFKNGEVDGLTTYYGVGCNIMSAQGNCSSNFRKQGKWVFVEKIEQTMPEGFQYITYTSVYKDDKVIEEPTIIYYHPSKKTNMEQKGNKKYYYLPSGKVMLEETYENKILREEIYTYESGKTAKHNKYYLQGSDSIVEFNWWFESGTVELIKKNVNGTTVVYEYYNSDGSKTNDMIQFEMGKEREKAELEKKLQFKKDQVVKYNNKLYEADTMYQRNPEGAIDIYKMIAKSADEALGGMKSNDTINKGFLLSKSKYVNEKIIECEKRIKKRSELNQLAISLDKKIRAKSDEFVKLYDLQTNTGLTNMIVDKIYPNGELIFKKADERVNELYKIFENEYNLFTDSSLESAIVSGEKVIAAFDRLIQISGGEAKELNKKLKKAKTREEELQILGF